MSLAELRKALGEKTLVLGSRKTISSLKNGRLKAGFLAENCREDVRKDVEHYAKLKKIEVIRLNKSNEEIGVLCKKQFSVSVLGY